MSLAYDEAHRLARTKGSNPVVYFVARLVLTAVMKVFFGLTATGTENVPKTGPVVIIPNHKSFWDPFFIAVVCRRRLHFMGKAELFTDRRARLFVALGGFPVRRGSADTEAIETARVILERGDVLALFPEGTRIPDPERLGLPRRGAARLAIETGAVIVPTVITGTERRRRHLPRRVRVAFGRPVPVTDLSPTPEHAGLLIDQTLWPAISDEYHRLRATPGTAAAALAALGVGYAILRRRSR